ncbi:carcinine hydrolase/isopenicillin-N N-acyltransferase family protein [Nannocystaceae bacterium ST9]
MRDEAEARGLIEGERFGPAIRALVEARAALLHARVGPAALEQARACFERLDALAPTLAAEQRGVAKACMLEPAALLVLDGGFVDVLLGEGVVERSLSFYVDGPRGPVLSGAWALSELEAEHVALRRVGDAGLRVLGLPGGLGMSGVASVGFAIQANLLRPASLGVGIPGSAALRLALDRADLLAARATLEHTPLTDGRSWTLADGRGLFGLEQLHEQCVLTRVSPKTGHVHTNHCFDPALRQREGLPRSAASFRRMELASTLYVQQRPNTAEQVLDFLAAVEAAAFPSGARANLHWALELIGGRVLLRRRASDPIEVFERETKPRETKPRETKP